MPAASPSSTSAISDIGYELFDISISRIFDAPRKSVFEAFNNPEPLN